MNADNCKGLGNKDTLVVDDEDMADIEAGANVMMKMLKGDGTKLDTSKFKVKMKCEVWGWEGFEEAAY